jgi:hypothetical protein
MANIFPKSSNWWALKLILAVGCIGTFVVCAIWYYFTPKYTRVGYMPTQPVEFSHAIHVKQLGLDCRYCHSAVETSATSSVPNTQTCMACHQQIQANNPKLAPIRKSWETGMPVQWVKIHKAPDYVYFNHSIHVSRGVSCYSCHGKINEMEVVWHHEPQSMGWCLQCHRNPQEFVRPLGEVYNLDWAPESKEAQEKMGQELVKQLAIKPPVTCTTCHR